MDKNIILIGMAGCGKSTIGVLLAKALGYEFIDTDLIIQKSEGRLLQDIINQSGLEYFLRAEQNALLSVNTSRAVIATGGSAVYSAEGMSHLKGNGICVWLKLPFSEIKKRIKNISTRGIAVPKDMTLEKAFDEREPLYMRYADITLECIGGVEDNVTAALDAAKSCIG